MPVYSRRRQKSKGDKKIDEKSAIIYVRCMYAVVIAPHIDGRIGHHFQSNIEAMESRQD